MKILAQFDNSREGNDCWLYEEWIKAQIFSEIVYLRIRRDSYESDVLNISKMQAYEMVHGYPEIKARLDA